jgi:hypothetical protein
MLKAVLSFAQLLRRLWPWTQAEGAALCSRKFKVRTLLCFCRCCSNYPHVWEYFSLADTCFRFPSQFPEQTRVFLHFAASFSTLQLSPVLMTFIIAIINHLIIIITIIIWNCSNHYYYYYYYYLFFVVYLCCRANLYFHVIILGARCSVVGWGIMLQVERSWFRF